MTPAELPGWPAAMQVPLAAAYLSVAETRLWELLRVGAIPSYALGRVRLINREALDRFRLGEEERQRAPKGRRKAG